MQEFRERKVRGWQNEWMKIYQSDHLKSLKYAFKPQPLELRQRSKSTTRNTDPNHHKSANRLMLSGYTKEKSFSTFENQFGKHILQCPNVGWLCKCFWEGEELLAFWWVCIWWAREASCCWSWICDLWVSLREIGFCILCF